MIVIVFLVFTGTQDTQDKTNEAEVVQEDQIALQSNLPVSPPRQSHFVTAATLEEDGYDSDKESNTNTTISNEDSMEVDEPALPKVGEESGMAGEQETHENGGEFVDIREATLKKLKVAELKEELSKRGQSTQGLKAVLLEWLREALGKHLPVTAADRAAHTTNDLKGFAPTARWKPLIPQEVPVSEPQNKTSLELCMPQLFQVKMWLSFCRNMILQKWLTANHSLERRKSNASIRMDDP